MMFSEKRLLLNKNYRFVVLNILSAFVFALLLTFVPKTFGSTWNFLLLMLTGVTVMPTLAISSIMLVNARNESLGYPMVALLTIGGFNGYISHLIVREN